MADVKDAIEVVTDPANVVARGDTHSDMRMVRDKRAVAAVRERGAGRSEARALIREAVESLGGRVESEVRASGRAVGPDARKAAEIYFVPAEAVRPEYP